MFTEPLWIIFWIAALGAVYVLLPVAAGVYGRYRFRKAVTCPETQAATSVQIDAAHAARTALFGEPRLRVEDCRYWPERLGCERKCLKQVA